MWCQNCNSYIPAGATVCPTCKTKVAEATPEEAPRQAVAPLDPAAAPPGAPSATPWMMGNYGGPPPTSASPYNPNQPGSQGGAYGGYAQPGYQPGVQPSAPWAGGPPREEPVILGFSRRELLASGAGGVAGLLFGIGGTALVSNLSSPTPSPLFWATTARAKDPNQTVVTVYRVSPAAVFSEFIPTSSPVVTNRTAADTLAAVASIPKNLFSYPEGWTLLYWTHSALSALTPKKFPAAALVGLSLQTGKVAKVFDVRVLTDQNGSGVAIVVAMTDGAGVPQIVFLSLANGALSQPVVNYSGGAPITDVSFVGPLTMPADNLLYLRVTAGDVVSSAYSDITRAAPTPTPLPTATHAPKPTATPTATKTATPSPPPASPTSHS